jgi:hypothetical protein
MTGIRRWTAPELTRVECGIGRRQLRAALRLAAAAIGSGLGLLASYGSYLLRAR